MTHQDIDDDMTPGLVALRLKYSQDELNHFVEFIARCADDYQPMTTSQLAVGFWAHRRNSTNAVTMWEVDAEAVLDEILLGFDKLLDIASFYDGPDASVQAQMVPMRALAAKPVFRDLVAGTLRAFMTWLKENPDAR